MFIISKLYTMEKTIAFTYFWFIDEKEENVTAFRIYCLNEKNETICLIINDFNPYVYIELPENVNWNMTNINDVSTAIDKLMGEQKPITKSLMHKHRLYYAHLEKDGSRKKFPYLFCSFANKEDISTLVYRLKRPFYVPKLGKVMMKVHESDADPILQFTTFQDIPTAGWIQFYGKKVEKNQMCTIADHEYKVSWRNVGPFKKDILAKPKIMGFDIEVNSTNPTTMPDAERQGDKVFQISCVFTREGDNDPKNFVSYLLSLGQPTNEIVGEHVKILSFKTESDLLVGFTKLIKKENPNVCVGYNILGFDIPYMIARARSDCTSFCIGEFDRMGFHKYSHAKERIIKWSSSAYKNQEFKFLDAEGRLFVDLLPLVKRDFKMDNYKLKTISEYFLKDDTKDPLSHKGIFKCYRDGTKKEKDGSFGKRAIKAISICGKYCVKDSELVVKLMDKLQTWTGLCEMAKTCGTSIFSLYTQGQQIKVYSQVYRYCFQNNMVVEKDGYVTKENDRYIGAYVFPPVPGVYDRVLPFDFCFTGDTLVSLSNGTTKRIDELKNDILLHGYNEKGFQNFSTINGLQEKGYKNTIKIYLQDGKTITCTPEHKFMLYDGSWCKAEELNNKEIMCGIEYPQDIKYDDEIDWKLVVDGYIFKMDSEIERQKSLAFSRILGFLLADGYIYLSNSPRSKLGYKECCGACFGTIIDAKQFINDIKIIIDIKDDIVISKKISDKKGTTVTIHLPSKISKMIHSLDGIVKGKRTDKEMTLPSFLLNDICPKSILREFLGGLYGGDGCTSGLCKNEKGFFSISFKWTVIEKYKENMIYIFDLIKKMHTKLGFDCNIYKPIKIKYGITSIKPKDYLKNPRYDIKISLLKEDILKFNEQIGFRYCVNKTLKLNIASSYQRLLDNIRKQHMEVFERTNELIDIHIKNVFSRKKGQITFTDCLNIAKNELTKKEIVINSNSLPSIKDIGYRRHENIRHSDKTRKMSIRYRQHVPSEIEYIKELGCFDWFTDNKYIVETDSIYIPSYKKKVIGILDNDIQKVYDIEVEKVHNFLTNGVVAHNCSLYPTTIIAYNIDYSTLVPDDSDIPNSKCHVFTWSDHVSCKDDPKVIRKNKLTELIKEEEDELKKMREERDKKLNKFRRNEIQKEIDERVEKLKPYREERSEITKSINKNVLCAERHYRFIKEPKGVLPTILQNLLDARKNTRGEIKKHNKEIEKLEKSDDNKQKIDDLNTLNNVLDKRQWAYKISANR